MPHHNVLSIAALKQPTLGRKPATTLLIGASLLRVQSRFGEPAFDLTVHASLVGDNASDTMKWVADELPTYGTLLLWRAEDLVVPALVSAAETASDAVVAAAMLRTLDRALGGNVVDVAGPHGGARATSFDRVAHEHGFPFKPMSGAQLAEAHRTFCYLDVFDHLRTRALTTWLLHLAHVGDEALQEATSRWLGDETAKAEAR